MARSRPGQGDTGSVAAFITLVACAASVLLALTAVDDWHAATERTGALVAFALLTLVLQVVTVDIYGRGVLSFTGTGMLAVTMYFGVGPGALVSGFCGVVLLVRSRSPMHRGVFNVANYALASAAAGGVYELLASGMHGTLLKLCASLVASSAFCVVNAGLLSVAMSLAEGLSPLAVWNERFRWFTPYYIASGPLALALIMAYDKLGVIGLIAFTVPAAMMMLSIRQYVARTRQSVEEVRAANDELRRANADLRDLFDFAGGLASAAHDGGALVTYAQAALERLTGGRATVTIGTEDLGGTPLVSGGQIVGTLALEGGDRERWARVRDAIEPQLATALESALLVDKVRKTHLETIAALSRSMEAKDYYTGGHTERVSEIAVALSRRLGFGGAELDAIEIGALLHDIGKIGIPEGILRKPGPLTDEEWVVMKEHPVISHFILSEVDLPQAVLDIARHSHERIDGGGYPDGLDGDEIPLTARIVLVADTFDALTSDRPYRNGRSAEAALEEVRRHTGTQFCPRVVEALEQLYREEPELLTRVDELPRLAVAS